MATKVMDSGEEGEWFRGVRSEGVVHHRGGDVGLDGSFGHRRLGGVPMSRTLLLMRHAKAEDGFEMADFDRVLSDKGRSQAERVGHLLVERGYTPDHVICSSAERTRRTLDGVLAAMELNPEVDHTEAAYLAGPESLLELITYVDSEVETLLVVGHNPTIAQVAASFVGDQALAAFSPATVAVVNLEVEWLYTAPGTGTGHILS